MLLSPCLRPFFCILSAALAMGASFACVGCGGDDAAKGAALTGNWQLTVDSPTAGANAVNRMTGYLYEQPGSGTHYVTSVLRVYAACYSDADIVPLTGTIKKYGLIARSFGVKGQFLNLDVTKSSDGASLTGTYDVGGGCANSSTGNLTGTRLPDLTGTYTGTFANQSGQTVSLNLTQNSYTGEGTFILVGSASFTGNACFSSGKVAYSGGIISGPDVSLLLTTDDGSHATVTMNGTMSTDATTLSFPDVTVSGGSCGGSLGTLTLKK